MNLDRKGNLFIYLLIQTKITSIAQREQIQAPG